MLDGDGVMRSISSITAALRMSHFMIEPKCSDWARLRLGQLEIIVALDCDYSLEMSGPLNENTRRHAVQKEQNWTRCSGKSRT